METYYECVIFIRTNRRKDILQGLEEAAQTVRTNKYKGGKVQAKDYYLEVEISKEKY
jgi:hypothetical protein